MTTYGQVATTLFHSPVEVQTPEIEPPLVPVPLTVVVDTGDRGQDRIHVFPATVAEAISVEPPRHVTALSGVGQL